MTIAGLVDFVATAYRNWSQFSGAPGAPDPTNDNGTGWYSRERGVFTLTGEVGRVKGVWAVELDFTNGAGKVNASSQPGSLTTVGVAQNGTSANFDLDTDGQGAIETKWLYLEAPLTGPGSLLPFILVATMVDTKGIYLDGILPSGIVSPGNPFSGGKARYLGNEWVARLTYQFTPNTVVDLAATRLIVGPALDIPSAPARDAYKLVARFRLTF